MLGRCRNKLFVCISGHRTLAEVFFTIHLGSLKKKRESCVNVPPENT